VLTAFPNNLERKAVGSENSSLVATRVFVVSRPASWKTVVLLLDLQLVDCTRGTQCYFPVENNLSQILKMGLGCQKNFLFRKV